jgi:hypothetical protein
LTLVPLLLVLFSAVVLRGQPLFAAMLMLQAAFYCAALYGFVSTFLQWKSGKLIAAPFYIVLGSIGAVAGILDACRGRRFDVWATPALSRGRHGEALRSSVPE